MRLSIGYLQKYSTKADEYAFGGMSKCTKNAHIHGWKRFLLPVNMRE